MKMKASFSKKLRYGGLSLTLTALIIAAVIIVNVIFSVLTQYFMLYSDLTPPLQFTLSEAFLDLIENGDDSVAGSDSPIDMIKKFREENKKYNEENGLTKDDPLWRDEELTLNIIFCDEPDAWKESTTNRFVSHSAHELEAKFPEYIKVSYVDTVTNPSKVSKYKENSLSKIYPTTVIVECGTEYRTRNVRGFFTFDSAEADTPWAYNGEKTFAADILAVTRAESPVACIEVGHGVSYDDYELLQTLTDAGYELSEMRLATDEIPDDCRLIVIMNPKMDFTTGDDGISDIDELAKLDAALERGVSMMVFISPDNPVLPNFEEFLEEWGIKFDRHTDDVGDVHSYMISDKTQGLTTDGYTIIADYAEENKQTAIFNDLTSRPSPPSVVFKNAMSISYPDHYQETTALLDEADDNSAYTYAYKTVDGVTTSVYDLFVTSKDAVAWANGREVEKATESERLKLMTVSTRTVITSESYFTSVADTTYIFACGSTDFASLNMLQTNAYGNNDALLSIFRTVGKELTPIGLRPKPFEDTTIDVVTNAEATRYTVIFTLIPAVVCFATGVVVLVRRKNR